MYQTGTSPFTPSDSDPSLVVGMQYARAVRLMVLDKMSGTNMQLEGVARVEDVAATNDNIQNVEVMLGVEITEVWGELRDAMRSWGDTTKRLSQE
jgi:hypothetical protein